MTSLDLSSQDLPTQDLSPRDHSPQDLPSLVDAIAATPYHRLLAIATCLGLPASKRTPKAELIGRLAAHLGLPRQLLSIHSALAVDAQQALADVVSAGGRVPLAVFTRRCGAIRPYRPWREDSVRRPWETPISVSERLLYHGLIFLQTDRRQPSPMDRVIVPAEFVTGLASTRQGPRSSSVRLTAAWPNPAFDLAVFLSVLQRQDITLVRGRWLPPSCIHAIAGQLRPPEPVEHVRGELQSRRVRMVHYLAQSLDLVTMTGRYTKPTPGALLWLAQPAADQLSAMWRAWLNPAPANLDLWRRYRLPGHDWPEPQAFVLAVLQTLFARPPGQEFVAEALTLQVLSRLVDALPAWIDEEPERPAAEIEGLLAGPLFALGVVCQSVVPSTEAWVLTPHGAWLLEREGGAPPADATALLEVGDDLTLAVPPGVQPAAVLALAPWTETDPDGRLLRLTPASVVANTPATLRHRGGTAPGEDLSGAADQPLDALFTLLARYARPLLRTEQRRRLQEMGYFAHPQRPVHAALKTDLDAGTLRWLAVGALVLDFLAGHFAASSVTPPSVKEDLARAMDPLAYAAAQAEAERIVAVLLQTIDGPVPTDLADEPADDLVARIEQAIQAGFCLELHYWSAGRGEITQRIVTPGRIEWCGDRLCLVGQCHLRQAERHFRLDRILWMSQVECPADPTESLLGQSR